MNSTNTLDPDSSKRPTFVDVFAGCGGLSLGLMQAGWRGLFAVEKDINAFKTLKHNLLTEGGSFSFDWPLWLPKRALNVRLVVTKYRSQLLRLRGKIDAVVGGPPCQGFSTAGRRDPNDPRNALVADYLDFVDLIRPKLVIIENVRGITADFKDKSAPDGKINYAEWIETELSKKYAVHSQLVDTSRFAVPQRRHRYFVIAFRRDLQGATACPFIRIEAARPAFLRKKGILNVPVGSKAAISDLEIRRNGQIPSVDSKGFNQIAYRGPLTNFQKVMNAGAVATALADTRLARHREEVATRFKKIIALCQLEGRLNTSLSKDAKDTFGLRKCAVRVMDPEAPAPTITSMPDDLLHYSEARTLTVRENARLQGFPDWFSFQGKYTTGGERRKKEIPRFTQVANAVPPLVAEAFGNALRSFLSFFDFSGSPKNLCSNCSNPS